MRECERVCICVCLFRFNVEYFVYLQQVERRNGWINVGDLQGAVHFKIVKYERIKFLVIALKDSIEIYAWAPKPYHKFMAFKSFGELAHRPLLVDLTVEEGSRLKVIYGSADGFHAVDLDSATVYDIYLPKHVRKSDCILDRCTRCDLSVDFLVR
jgi:TRAF2 and NCK interacting kinase